MSKILFADDDLAMRQLITDILASAGHSVLAVADGASALTYVRTDTPDLALLDYRMGDPDGFEVCRRIKSDPQLEHLPVLILTGESDVEDRIRGFQSGANDYLPKPFDARELLARVHSLLTLAEQARGLNPSTGLPGGTVIEREFELRRLAGRPFTLCYLDLENFKSFNDTFGFALANGLIEYIGKLLRSEVAGTKHFAGHIGGDDFVILCEPGVARPLVEAVQARLREALSRFLPSEVVERGQYMGRLRNGDAQYIPLTRLTAVLLHLEPRRMPGLASLAEMAAEGKGHAKLSAGDGIVEVEIRG